MADGQIIDRKAFDKWNKTAMGDMGRWHEAQAETLKHFLRIAGSPLRESRDALEADIAFHTKCATCCLEAQ